MPEGHIDADAEPARVRLVALKRHAILDGARTVFLREGYSGSSMDQISVQAGVSKGTLYHHFEGKDALFQALVLGEAARIADALPSIDREEPDPAVALRRLAVSIMEVAEAPETLSVLRLVIGAHGSFPSLGETFLQAAAGRLVRQLAAYLKAQPSAGGPRIVDNGGAAMRFVLRCFSHSMESLLVGHSHGTASQTCPTDPEG